MPQLVLLFSDDLALEEEEDKESGNHEIESSCCGDDIVVEDISVMGQRKSSSLDNQLYRVSIRQIIIDDGLIDCKLNMMGSTFRAEAV